ncbi:uncharacterized protein BCR38DRAFT_449179 [Pseudomassariella vexata]|uniref:Tyrosinase copper-binding domain-containing protein n=1 Tax=Pseudomassariella vexata TaxID=1141098 RepID=A0A1Y2DFI7_9PEZI|nr:uncharacterized protein BCR38DRAFT_449179 [Pseudomassariella vexata]ORY57455.1 hypothetical protein BCR38DRAFT_449179 [Pseudomassariella vexata]
MVGRFLPWHRIYLALFEADLKSSCGYQGALPYWDWSLDVTTETSFLESPIFDPVYGFGGNGAFIEDVSNITQTSGVPVPGRSGGGCLTTGPWANFTVNMGPGESTEYTPSCLRRDIAPEFASRTCAKAMVDWTLEEDDFALFDMRIEAMNLTLDGTTTHACGHWGVGGQVGQMADVWSSPGDPIFYQHHANIDYLWYKWQMLDWPARKTAIGGPDVAGAYPFLFFGDIPYNNVTLDYELDLGMIGGNITVRDVMDTTAGKLCYTYE